MTLLKMLQETGQKKDCYEECRVILSGFSDGIMRKVINRNDPWGEKPGFYVRHTKGDYKTHFVVQIGDSILDPFLKERDLIPVRNYLEETYKNPEDLRII